MSRRLDGDPITCAWPIWQGTYQVGQPNQLCTLDPGYVRSASNTVPASTSGT